MENPITLEFIKKHVPKVKYVLMVCTGSGIVAKTGLLDGELHEPTEIVGHLNYLYITDYWNNRIQIFDLNGNYINNFKILIY